MAFGLLVLFLQVALVCTAGTAKANGPETVRTDLNGSAQFPFPAPSHPLTLAVSLDYSVTIAHSGLNNILWSLMFAMKSGCNWFHRDKPNGRGRLRRNLAVILPVIGRDVNSMSNATAQHHFSEIFDMNQLQQVLWEQEQCLVTDRPSLERMIADGRVVVAESHRHIVPPFVQKSVYGGNEKSRRIKGGTWLALLYKGLSPSQHLRDAILSPCLKEVRSALGSDSFITVHMRVEDDWKEHCIVVKHRHAQLVGNCFFDPKQVADRVLAIDELRNGYKRVLMLYAENNLNSPRSVKAFGETSDPMHAWPADWVVTTPMRLRCFSSHRMDAMGLTYTQQSAVNFFLSVEAGRGKPFVGHSMSTMTLAMQVIRHLRGYEGGFYWYNCKSSPGKAINAPPIMETHTEVVKSHLYRHDPPSFCCPSTIPIEVC